MVENSNDGESSCWRLKMIRYWANIQQAKLGFDYQDAAALVPLPFILLDNFRA
jgi:hypothetical protein